MATALPLIPWSKTSILTCKMHLNSSRIAQHAALDLFVLGFPKHANTLLEAIHEHDLDTTTSDYYGRTTDAQLRGAWEVSGTMPSWQSWQDDSDPDAICTTGLPNGIAKKAEEKVLTVEDVDSVRKRMNTKPDATYKNPEDTVTLGAVIHVALLAGEELLATKLVEEDMKELYLHLQEEWNDPDADGDELRDWLENRQGLEHCPEIWKMLRSANLGTALGVREADIDAFVKEGCALIKQRSTQGPARAYADKTMAELVRMMNENFLAERENEGKDDVPTLFKAGASEAQITALEERLARSPAEDDPSNPRVMLPGKQLPDDYKDFLRASNGIQFAFNEEDVFFAAEDVEPEGAWMHNLDYTLFPSVTDYTYGSDEDEVLEEIPLGEYTCFTIGTGDGEGNVTLIPPESVRPVVEKFEKVYADASERNKRVCERAALDLYGGLDQLRKLEWLCIEFQHSAYEQRIWGGFRPYIEEYVKRGVDERKEAERRSRKHEKKRKRDGDEKKADGGDAQGSGKGEEAPESKAQRTD